VIAAGRDSIDRLPLPDVIDSVTRFTLSDAVCQPGLL